MLGSAAYQAAILEVAGPRLQKLVAYWLTDWPGNPTVEAAGEAAYSALDMLSPEARGFCMFDAIRLVHFEKVRGFPITVTWPHVPLTAIDYRRFPQLATFPSIDLSEAIFDLMKRLAGQDLAFSEAMLCELLILMRHPDGGYGVFCTALLNHLEAAATAGEATDAFRRELRLTAAWLEANQPYHQEDYWGRFRAAAARRLPALVR